MANTEGGLGSMVSTKEMADMERAIGALALELPAEVWEDVKARWHAARDSLRAEVERLALALGARNTEAELEWIEENNRVVVERDRYRKALVLLNRYDDGLRSSNWDGLANAVQRALDGYDD